MPDFEKAPRPESPETDNHNQPQPVFDVKTEDLANHFKNNAGDSQSDADRDKELGLPSVSFDMGAGKDAGNGLDGVSADGGNAEVARADVARADGGNADVLDFSPPVFESVLDPLSKKRLPTGRGDESQPESNPESQPESQPESGPDSEPKPESIQQQDAGPDANNDAGDAPGENKIQLESDSDYWQDKPRLTKDQMLESAEQHITDPSKLAEFRQDVDAFENRAEGDGVSDIERETFYGQVGKVLDASAEGNRFYNQDQLRTIAGDMMKHAGSPGTVNQGTEPTCTTAAMESILYAKEPNTIGEVVSEAALTGQYETSSGDVIKIPERNLMPNKYALEDTPEQKARSLASNIFQPLAINMKWNGEDSYPGQAEGKKGKLVYEEGHPKDHIGDPQTRIMDYSQDPPRPVTEEFTYGDILADKDAPTILNSEQRPASAPLMYMDDLPRIYSDLKGREGSLPAASFEKAEGVDAPQSLDEFKNYLESADYPVLLGVHANLEPFASDLSAYNKKDDGRSDAERKSESNMHAHHAVAVFDYDAETGMVSVENQWGAAADHTGGDGNRERIAVDDLYRSFRGLSPEESKALDSKEDRKEPTPDEIIDSQAKFVDEIAADSEQDPQKVWQERRELVRRLDHFGRGDEATEQRDILKRDYQKLVEGKDVKQSMQLATDLSSTLSAGGDEAGAKEVLADLDRRYLESHKDAVDSDDRNDHKADDDAFEMLMSAHKRSGDEEGAKALLTGYLDGVFGEDSNLDIASENDRSVMTDALKYADHYGDAEVAGKYFDTMVADLGDLEKKTGAEGGAGAELNQDNIDASITLTSARADVLYAAHSLGRSDVANGIADKMQPEYDQLNQAVESEADFSAKPLSELRSTLFSHYQQTRNPEGMSAIADDYMNFHENLAMEDGKPRGTESPKLISPLRYFGKDLQQGGAYEKSAEFLERGLALAKQHDPDEVDWIVGDLVMSQFKAGNTERAQELVKEYDLPEYAYRRFMKKDN